MAGFRIASSEPYQPRQKTAPQPKKRGMKRERGRQQDRAHLALIRKLPCIVSGETVNVVAAHVRFSSADFRKVGPGGAKPDDRWTVPLAARLHTDETEAQHRHGEEVWWSAQGIDVLSAAMRLYAVSEALRGLGRPEDEIVQAMTFVINKARAGGKST